MSNVTMLKSPPVRVRSYTQQVFHDIVTHLLLPTTLLLLIMTTVMISTGTSVRSDLFEYMFMCLWYVMIVQAIHAFKFNMFWSVGDAVFIAISYIALTLLMVLSYGYLELLVDDKMPPSHAMDRAANAAIVFGVCVVTVHLIFVMFASLAGGYEKHHSRNGISQKYSRIV